jgi:hypothetical protein
MEIGEDDALRIYARVVQSLPDAFGWFPRLQVLYDIRYILAFIGIGIYLSEYPAALLRVRGRNLTIKYENFIAMSVTFVRPPLPTPISISTLTSHKIHKT